MQIPLSEMCDFGLPLAQRDKGCVCAELLSARLHSAAGRDSPAGETGAKAEELSGGSHIPFMAEERHPIKVRELREAETSRNPQGGYDPSQECQAKTNWHTSGLLSGNLLVGRCFAAQLLTHLSSPFSV